ncbi:hypothetical protein TSOC_003090 [Tetrabaena socialis]|uniref:Uncharacterized protein n=1 Tax=Tetrabaena socialis TaxID=47790 RepID=A0A2J8ACG4_9CHLO|nr:hypothetical protein TSOC_003090 [Tetrabaena socialis]|eukprot:PNH10197.1 hypothetical protein TSOC_003090 [Tetrabaena socialis]
MGPIGLIGPGLDLSLDAQLRDASTHGPLESATQLTVVHIIADRKIASNLFLQQLLYYRLFFNVAWLGFWMVFIFRQYWQGLKLKDNDIVRTIFFILWFMAEPVRLVAGWYGNLQENVPWLLMFVILSVFPEQGTIIYLFIGTFVTPRDGPPDVLALPCPAPHPPAYTWPR